MGVPAPACICSHHLFDCLGYNGSWPNHLDSTDHDSEFGRIIYTLSMLLMFSFVILLLMIRSIRRSSSTVEMETLLDAMRYREEYDLMKRQKRRLQKAKSKVSAWLARNNTGVKQWHSSPQLLIGPRKYTNQSSTCDIPEIVVTPHSDDALSRIDSLRGRATPALSLLYDFDEHSLCQSQIDIRLSEISTRSGSLDLDDSLNSRQHRSSQLELIPSDSESTSTISC